MLNDADWVELLEHLLNRLVEMRALDIVMEIREAVASRVIEEAEETSDTNLSLFPEKYIENSNKEKTLRSRQLSSEEAFLKSVEVIETRLDALPKIGQRISHIIVQFIAYSLENR